MPRLTDLIYGAAAAATSPVWAWRLWRTGKWRTDWSGRFGRASLPHNPAGDGRPTLLIHAVSVGEVNAVRGLVERLGARHGDALRIVVSTTTDTGTARARSLFEPRHAVVRYPLDFTGAVRRFLDAVRPAMVVLVELEVWPTFVAECGRRGVPVLVVNGRLSERSYRRYRLVRPLVRRTFGRLAAAAVQDAAYGERFIAMGMPAERVSVTGSMKWDAAPIRDDVPGSAELGRAMGIDPARPLIVCGSTGPGEEAMLVEQLADATGGASPPSSMNGVQVLIAPRKPERFEEAAVAMGEPVRRTRHPDGTRREPDGRRLFLLDTIGELARAYALADVAVVGRSFGDLYGSDMIEPIALGRPTVIGPSVGDFRDIMDRFLAGDGIVQVDGPEGLRRAVAALLEPAAGRALAERGRAVIRQQQGATDRHVELIERHIGVTAPV